MHLNFKQQQKPTTRFPSLPFLYVLEKAGQFFAKDFFAAETERERERDGRKGRKETKSTTEGEVNTKKKKIERNKGSLYLFTLRQSIVE